MLLTRTEEYTGARHFATLEYSGTQFCFSTHLKIVSLSHFFGICEVQATEDVSSNDVVKQLGHVNKRLLLEASPVYSTRVRAPGGWYSRHYIGPKSRAKSGTPASMCVVIHRM